MLALGLLCFVLAAVMLVPLALGRDSSPHASQWIGGFAFLAASILLLWFDRQSREPSAPNAERDSDANGA